MVSIKVVFFMIILQNPQLKKIPKR